MPIYRYKCQECDFDDEIRHSIKDPALKLCPRCDMESLERLINGIPHITVKEIKSVAQLAEHNSKLMGKEQVELKMESQNIRKNNEGRARVSEMYKLANLSDEKKKKYIETGKT